MDLLEQFKQILKTKTFSQSAMTILATIFSGILGLFFYLTLAKQLGPTSFGIFSVAVATLSLLADVGDLGTDAG
jgi:O-antigen/teichoic acid export membrane protein